MVSNENPLLNIDAFNGLSEEERKLALEILKEYSQEGTSNLLNNLKYGDFEETPVDIDTFLDDDHYLGKGLWEVDALSGARRCTIFPYWRETLKKLFQYLITNLPVLMKYRKKLPARISSIRDYFPNVRTMFVVTTSGASS